MSTPVLVLIIAAALLAMGTAFVAGVFAGCWLVNQSWAEEVQRKEQIEEAWKKSQLRGEAKL